MIFKSRFLRWLGKFLECCSSRCGCAVGGFSEGCKSFGQPTQPLQIWYQNGPARASKLCPRFTTLALTISVTGNLSRRHQKSTRVRMQGHAKIINLASSRCAKLAHYGFWEEIAGDWEILVCSSVCSTESKVEVHWHINGAGWLAERREMSQTRTVSLFYSQVWI